MYCVRSRQTLTATVKHSRFIGVVIPCTSEREARRHLQQLHDEHPNANHIAFAYRIQTPAGLAYRFHDAGEPAGTAGRPIFQHLEGKNLVNLLVAVIRYFGGVKLGAGGLTRAYGNTAKKTLEAAHTAPYLALEQVVLELAYPQMPKLEYWLRKLQGQIVEQSFSERITVLIELPADHKNQLLQELSQLGPSGAAPFEHQRSQ